MCDRSHDMDPSVHEPARRPLLEEETYTIETPEHVEIVYTVAGPGSRLLAFILDSIIMTVPALAILVFIFIIISSLSRGLLEDFLEQSRKPDEAIVVWLMLAFFTMAEFLVSQLYFVVFEVAWNGQSPGKRWQGIRVIRESGQPVGFFASMIRNLIRFVDMFPASYLVAFVTMLASRHWRRLGDLAAGTIVVKVGSGRSAARSAGAEAVAPLLDPSLVERFEQAGISRLDPGFFDLAERFIERRDELDVTAAASLAEKIARPAMERLATTDVQPETFLEQAVAYRRSRR